MPSTVDLLKKTFEDKYSKLVDEVYQFMKTEIIRTCDKENLSFTTAYMFIISRNVDGEELENHHLHKLVFWYEEYFGLFPQIIYDAKDKKWWDGTGTE